MSYCLNKAQPRFVFLQFGLECLPLCLCGVLLRLIFFWRQGNVKGMMFQIFVLRLADQQTLKAGFVDHHAAQVLTPGRLHLALANLVIQAVCAFQSVVGRSGVSRFGHTDQDLVATADVWCIAWRIVCDADKPPLAYTAAPSILPSG